MTKDMIKLNDLIELLRQIENNDYRTTLLAHTADTAKRCCRALAAQAAEIERLREALRPFAECATWAMLIAEDDHDAAFRRLIDDCRRARAALADEGGADNG